MTSGLRQPKIILAQISPQLASFRIFNVDVPLPQLDFTVFVILL